MRAIIEFWKFQGNQTPLGRRHRGGRDVTVDVGNPLRLADGVGVDEPDLAPYRVGGGGLAVFIALDPPGDRHGSRRRWWQGLIVTGGGGSLEEAAIDENVLTILGDDGGDDLGPFVIAIAAITHLKLVSRVEGAGDGGRAPLFLRGHRVLTHEGRPLDRSLVLVGTDDLIGLAAARQPVQLPFAEAYHDQAQRNDQEGQGHPSNPQLLHVLEPSWSCHVGCQQVSGIRSMPRIQFSSTSPWIVTAGFSSPRVSSACWEGKVSVVRRSAALPRTTAMAGMTAAPSRKVHRQGLGVMTSPMKHKVRTSIDHR